MTPEPQRDVYDRHQRKDRLRDWIYAHQNATALALNAVAPRCAP